jgi:hypothetical protein
VYDASTGHHVPTREVPHLRHETRAGRPESALRKHTMRARHAAGLTTVVTSFVACVSADAGYQDVRKLTTDRIRHEVRWSTRDSAGSPDKQTQALLAHPLTSDAAVQLALWNNQGLQAEFEDLGVGRARLVQALRLPNPTADASLEFERSKSTNIELHGLISIFRSVVLASARRRRGRRVGCSQGECRGQDPRPRLSCARGLLRIPGCQTDSGAARMCSCPCANRS